MSDTEEALKVWMEALYDYHLPRWEELPDIDLYMDQVITLIDRYLSPLVENSDGHIITAAMINNYVKLNIMPKPNKKRYERIHLAYLIVITILKQVLLISEVKDGIFLQCNIDDIHDAYDLFCDRQETALRSMIDQSLSRNSDQKLTLSTVDPNRLGLHMACVSFAGKIFTEKIISLHMQKNLNKEKKVQ